MISLTKIRMWVAALLVLLMIGVAPLKAPAQSWKQMIVKCSPEDFQQVQRELGAAIMDAIPGYYLVNVNSATDESKIEKVHGKNAILASENLHVSLPRRAGRSTTGARVSKPLLGASVNWYGSPARQAYTNQPTVAKIRLKDALQISTGQSVRVAVIDTGVDEMHPTLKSALLPGKNYVGFSSVPSEWNDPTLSQSTAAILDQSTAAILDQSTAVILDQSTAVILDQSTAAILDQYPAFGHGTMMSGLIHLVAPDARIIPLKVFDATGDATEWNVVRAIYDAVNMGAEVINMSFSASKKSKMIEAAVNAAVAQGVVIVVSSGNDNSDAPTYPASLDASVGISSVDQNDLKAPFSNFGKYVDLSAPGVDLISTFPGNRFAMGSGTSGSVALVTGVFALVRQQRNATVASLRQKVESAADPVGVLGWQVQYQNKLGKGRINALKAVR